MAHDPISGPISRDTLRSLVDAPYGQATKEIRKYDPQYGREAGEKFIWKVTAQVKQEVVAYVDASSQEEADKLADHLTGDAFDYERDLDDIKIISVEPDKN